MASLFLQVSDDVDNPTGNRVLWDSGLLNGAPNKVDLVAHFYVGEAITGIAKTALVAGGQEVRRRRRRSVGSDCQWWWWWLYRRSKPQDLALSSLLCRWCYIPRCWVPSVRSYPLLHVVQKTSFSSSRWS